jgi:hypothetical protein
MYATGSVHMKKSMDDLSIIIKGQIELYEEQMSNALAEGNEEDVRKINEDFEKEVGSSVCAFAKMAGEPLKSMLVSLFEGCKAYEYEKVSNMRENKR